jgi:hypothetical protein
MCWSGWVFQVILFFALRTTDKTTIAETTNVIISTWAGNSGTVEDGTAVRVGLGEREDVGEPPKA